MPWYLEKERRTIRWCSLNKKVGPTIWLSFALLLALNAAAGDFPTIDDSTTYLVTTESGKHQKWTFTITDSDLRLYSADVLKEEAGVTGTDFLVGSTPYYTRLSHSADSSKNCADEMKHHEGAIFAVLEKISLNRKTQPSCHVHTEKNKVIYDVWYGNVPFAKMKFKITGGSMPGRYMVEPGEGNIQ